MPQKHDNVVQHKSVYFSDTDQAQACLLVLLAGAQIAAQREQAALVRRAGILDVLRLPERLVRVLVLFALVPCCNLGVLVVANAVVQVAGAERLVAGAEVRVALAGARAEAVAGLGD